MPGMIRAVRSGVNARRRGGAVAATLMSGRDDRVRCAHRLRPALVRLRPALVRAIDPHLGGLYARPVSSDPQILRAGDVARAIRVARLVAVLRRIEPRDRLLALVAELIDDGISIFEITFDAADAAADVAAVRERFGPDATVGAGTVRTHEQLRAAIDAGAAFGVSPVLDPAILRAALEAGLPFVPGAYTPSEVDLAWRAGATFVKLFPGSSLGPEHVRELRGPMPEVETIVTGGIDGTNAVRFI
ncbi:MAG: 2-dehydro-3-deoxyphosphogluconate aldolase / (4S)-4-hydroxy-2-oxoglutarate aldolase, partial [Chloroflexota bacterium]|nr:2-dehydro-3-deoxyphosphogluconate aldolase / (4S)-4-hydroxy-2-oxoglutarate aldolase [Chloroflexota bacterium]